MRAVYGLKSQLLFFILLFEISAAESRFDDDLGFAEAGGSRRD
jgi:hypothetical protein